MRKPQAKVLRQEPALFLQETGRKALWVGLRLQGGEGWKVISAGVQGRGHMKAFYYRIESSHFTSGAVESFWRDLSTGVTKFMLQETQLLLCREQTVKGEGWKTSYEGFTALQARNRGVLHEMLWVKWTESGYVRQQGLLDLNLLWNWREVSCTETEAAEKNEFRNANMFFWEAMSTQTCMTSGFRWFAEVEPKLDL